MRNCLIQSPGWSFPGCCCMRGCLLCLAAGGVSGACGGGCSQHEREQGLASASGCHTLPLARSAAGGMTQPGRLCTKATRCRCVGNLLIPSGLCRCRQAHRRVCKVPSGLLWLGKCISNLCISPSHRGLSAGCGAAIRPPARRSPDPLNHAHVPAAQARVVRCSRGLLCRTAAGRCGSLQRCLSLLCARGSSNAAEAYYAALLQVRVVQFVLSVARRAHWL